MATITMLDQMLFPLACRHTAVLGRLEGKTDSQLLAYRRSFWKYHHV